MPDTTLTFNASAAEQHVSANEFYSTVTVTNNTNQPVFIAVDGSTATSGGAGDEVVEVGAVGVFFNEQPLPNWDVPGVTPETGTAQQGHFGTGVTYCSVIPLTTTSASAGNLVTVVFE